jgi:hypothetical protein
VGRDFNPRRWESRSPWTGSRSPPAHLPEASLACVPYPRALHPWPPPSIRAAQAPGQITNRDLCSAAGRTTLAITCPATGPQVAPPHPGWYNAPPKVVEHTEQGRELAIMTRRHWIIIAALAASACLLAGGLSALYLVNNVPAAARLVRREASAPLSQHTPAPTSKSPQSGWIAFETDRGELGDYEIYAMAPDGSRLINLTQSWADDLAPVWSPDGQRIAFVSLRDTLAGKWGMGPRSIYVMEFDPHTGAAGANVARLTGEDMDAGWPTWSPDGARVAFGSDRSGNPTSPSILPTIDFQPGRPTAPKSPSPRTAAAILTSGS